jgi:2-hydroxy-4-carboxymuconate semialdehyde hemiacetal dehydrogenase
MRLCVVGYGMMGQAHARAFRQLGEELYVAVGRVPERTAAYAQEWGYARHTTDLAAALADPAVEAVVLCTPSGQHAEQTRQALLADKHVLVEIPLAMSFREGQELAALAQERGRTVLVGHTQRYYPAQRRAKEMVERGELTPHNCIARYVFMRHENVGATGYRRSWTDNLLWHHGCHAVDMALWLLGVQQAGEVEVTSLVALPDQQMGIPMDLSVLVRTTRDQLGSVDMSYNAHISLNDYLLIGREDTLLMTRGTLRGKQGVLYDPATDAAGRPNGVLDQDREFVAAVREQRPSAIDPEAVLPALDVLQRVQDAWDAWRPSDAMHPIAP